MNVAITRARYCLFVVGNAKTLKSDNNWSQLVDFCKAKQCFKSFLSLKDFTDFKQTPPLQIKKQENSKVQSSNESSSRKRSPPRKQLRDELKRSEERGIAALMIE